MPIRNSQAPGFRPVYPQTRQTSEDQSSVCSDQPMQTPDSQSDLSLVAKAEVEEVLRSFAQTTQQQRDQVMKTIQEREVMDTPALSIWQAGLEQAIQGLPTTAACISQRIMQTQEALHGRFTLVQSDVSQGFRSLEDIIAGMTASLQKQTSALQVKMKNIEKRVKRVKKHPSGPQKPRQAFYPPGFLGPVRTPQARWCDCILNAGRRMTRMDRIRGMQEGRLVCTCRKGDRK